MDLVNVLHMNAGDRICSYANCSALQKYVILKSAKVLEDTIEDYGTNGFSECFKLADLGCSSGPNTFLFVANTLDNVHKACAKKNLKAPDEFQVFLNDLPNNDFNTVFKMTPSFYSKLENDKALVKPLKCFVCGVPGSFYARLFPGKSLNFVHSSYGVHWLSQVPENLLDNNRGNIYMAKASPPGVYEAYFNQYKRDLTTFLNLLDNNKGNIYMAKASPPGVYEAYFNQYKRDLTTFLRMRSEEIIPDGRMVLALLGRRVSDPASKDCCYLYELLAKSLHDLVAEGSLHEEDISSFNLPFYTPCPDELKTIIESESSFCVDILETFEVKWDMRDEDEIIKSGDSSGKFVAKTTRAVMEPLLASHFGNNSMEQIFERFAKHVDEHLSRGEKGSYFNILVSLRRRK